MSTRSIIAIKETNGKVRAIYCHWDGYPEHNGIMLLQHYTDTEKVKELIELGDISYLDKEVKPKNGEKHTFENPMNGVTVAYHRDRGEKYSAPIVYDSVEKFINNYDKHFSWCEYAYLFDVETKKWTWYACEKTLVKIDADETINKIVFGKN